MADKWAVTGRERIQQTYIVRPVLLCQRRHSNGAVIQIISNVHVYA